VWFNLSEERSYQKPQPAKLTKVHELGPDTQNPVRVLGIVVDSTDGMFLIQDIYDDAEDTQKSIWVSCDQALEVEKKYLLIGNVLSETLDDEKRMRLDATIALNVEGLDVLTYREAVEMESEVIKAVKS
jgi:hypothetical protein